MIIRQAIILEIYIQEIFHRNSIMHWMYHVLFEHHYIRKFYQNYKKIRLRLVIIKTTNWRLYTMNINFLSNYHQLYNQHHPKDNKARFLVRILCLWLKMIPNNEEHPGPPFSQIVKGSVLAAPLADSTKT